jgi:hypothetical protein
VCTEQWLQLAPFASTNLSFVVENFLPGRSNFNLQVPASVFCKPATQAHNAYFLPVHPRPEPPAALVQVEAYPWFDPQLIA